MAKSVPRRTAASRTHRALNKRLVAIQAEIARLRRMRASVKREEFIAMRESLRQIEENAERIARQSAELAVQFTRMAHLQAEVDLLKHALIKAGLLER